MKIKTLFLVLMVSTLSVQCNKKANDQVKSEDVVKMKCAHKGAIKDMTDLDGCTYFIVTEDGKRLAPVNWEMYDVELKDGMVVSFEVDMLRDAMSICMSEDAIVRLKCFQVLK